MLQMIATWRKPGSSRPRHLMSSRQQTQTEAARQTMPCSSRRKQSLGRWQMGLHCRKTLRHLTSLLRMCQLSPRTQLYSCRLKLLSRPGCLMQRSLRMHQVTCQMSSSQLQLQTMLAQPTSARSRLRQHQQPASLMATSSQRQLTSQTRPSLKAPRLQCCMWMTILASRQLLAVQSSRQQMSQTLRQRQQRAAGCSLMRLVTLQVRLLLGRQLALEVQMDPVMAHWDCSPRQERQMGSQMQRIQTAALLTRVLELQRRQLQVVPRPHPMQSLLRIRHQQMKDGGSAGASGSKQAMPPMHAPIDDAEQPSASFADLPVRTQVNSPCSCRL